MGTAKENSEALLVALYKATGGQMHTRAIAFETLGQTLGLDRAQSRTASHRLTESGLVKPLGIGAIALTPEGKEAAEALALTPQQRAENEATARTVLGALYEAAGRGTDSVVGFVETAAKAGIERDLAVNLFDDFIARGWVKSFGTGRHVRLTNVGVDLVEESA